jgi:hypothetical protein
MDKHQTITDKLKAIKDSFYKDKQKNVNLRNVLKTEINYAPNKSESANWGTVK